MGDTVSSQITETGIGTWVVGNLPKSIKYLSVGDMISFASQILRWHVDILLDGGTTRGMKASQIYCSYTLSYITGLGRASGIDVRKNFGWFGDKPNVKSKGKNSWEW